MEDFNPKWNTQEFLCFVLIHASYADLEFSDDEKHHIIESFGQSTFEDIHAAYNELAEYEILELIKNYKGLFFPTAARKQEMLSHVHSLFNIDGDYTRLEKSLMLFLEKFL